MQILDDFLNLLGINIEQRDPPAGVQAVDTLDKIGAIFDSDAARQKSESHYFSGNTGPPKFARGHGGAKIPNFAIPPHLDPGSGYGR